jgi:hypothetical protein
MHECLKNEKNEKSRFEGVWSQLILYYCSRENSDWFLITGLDMEETMTNLGINQSIPKLMLVFDY